MKSIIPRIKNLIPYLFLIGIYFFFVNLEARNDLNTYKRNSKIMTNENDFKEDNADINNKNFTISIPVIPYSK
tara:strand:+ start:299 stop:517 length:219 start_codon:yes stop_codon:yes gene_type:complete